jgi:transposase InsO family protein
VHKAHFEVYGAQKLWRQLGREGFSVARCTVARLMRVNGIAGAIRGKPLRTTFSDKAAPCPKDHVIPTPIDQYPRSQFRSPMDMMRHGWLISLFHA